MNVETIRKSLESTSTRRLRDWMAHRDADVDEVIAEVVGELEVPALRPVFTRAESTSRPETESPMSLSSATTSVTRALQAYDRDITVKVVTLRVADLDGPAKAAVEAVRLLVGEKSRKGFKSLGTCDLAIDDNGDITAACKFSTRSEALTARCLSAI